VLRYPWRLAKIVGIILKNFIRNKLAIVVSAFAIVLLVVVFFGVAGCKQSTLTSKNSYVGSASCRECHEDAYQLWAKSNHGLAERFPRPDMDNPAFVPARAFRLGSQETSVEATNGSFWIRSIGLSGKPEMHEVARVIGNDPLRQFLVAAPGGRWQTMEASYDPHRNDWFDVFGNEDRQPGEWGHWTGRGMNWNSMCAECHNTRLHKNYDEATDSYHTTMAEMTVSCEACHGPLKAHVDWQKQYRNKGTTDPTMPKPTPAQTMDTCASCHSRRSDLTGDFKPGDSFFDHFDLSIVDHSDLFYPDGQIHDEDYEFTAFYGSKMHQAGVTCLDCHPRSLHMPRPQGNAVCLRCHAGGFMKAPIIQPEEHSHHALGTKGDDCVDCHMPVTVYMQRHPRHDHGLTIPDPLLTKKLGIPNACNKCHTDKSVDWSLTAVDKWYGAKMNRPSRERTEWIALARQGNATAREPLVNLLNNETNSYWQAVAAGLLDQWVGDGAVDSTLTKALENKDPLVRGTAVRSLEPLIGQSDSGVTSAIRKLLDDPSRNVRISAAWALRADLDTNSPAGRDLLHYLDINADQPSGQMQKGVFYFSRGDLPTALAHLEKAVSWDTNSAPLHHEFAIALSSVGRSAEAIQQLEIACRLAPREASYFYELGLAWNDAGDLSKTIEMLETAVKLDPNYDHAWYNLGLARNSAGQVEPALDALSHAEALATHDPRIPYAAATILAHQGRKMEAKAAAQRALNIQPNFPEALQLIETLSR